MEIQEASINVDQTRSSDYESFFQASARQSLKLKEANEIYVSSVESKLPDLEIGVEIPTIDAVGWSRKDVDIRPRLVDKSTNIARLIDSGAMISAAARRPEDKPSEGISLVAVNGSRIKTYGVRDLEFKINRKTYKIEAVICDISQDILGMDFLDKYKLNLEWDETDQSELFIVDKKAQIRSKLKIVTVPTNL